MQILVWHDKKIVCEKNRTHRKKCFSPRKQQQLRSNLEICWWRESNGWMEKYIFCVNIHGSSAKSLWKRNLFLENWKQSIVGRFHFIKKAKESNSWLKMMFALKALFFNFQGWKNSHNRGDGTKGKLEKNYESSRKWVANSFF